MSCWGIVSIDGRYLLEMDIDARFGKPVSMPVDDLDGLIVVDADMVWLDAHNGPQFLVKLIDCLESVSSFNNMHQPEVGKLCEERGGDPS